MAYRPPSSAPLPGSGTLKEVPFADILVRAARERKSGTLELSGDKVEKAFFFINGIVAGARSNLPAESLAKMVVVRGKATREVVEGLGVPLLDDDKVKAALVAKVSKDDLDEVLRYQLLFRVADTFARPGLTFRWSEPQQLANPIALNAFQMFSEGAARRLTKDNMVNETIDLLDLQPVLIPKPVFAIDGPTLPTRAAQLFRRIDGRTTLGELVDNANRTVSPEQIADSTYRSWVYLVAFLEGGFIEIPSASEESALEPEGADSGSSANGTVMVVTSAGGAAMAYTEVDDPAVTARFEAMQTQNLFEVLGIDEKVTDAQVKKAYFKLAKEFHPDKLYNHKERTVKKFADKAFAVVNKAYEQLKTEAGRKEYIQKQQEIASGLDLDKEAESLLKSEVEFQKGLVFLRKKDFPNAVNQFRSALELNPRESDHFAYCGYSEFQVSYPKDEPAWREAVAKLDKSLEMNPKNHEAMFFLANISKLIGQMEKAEQLFNKVLKFRPNHVEAQRELRLIQQRRDKEVAEAGKDKKLVDKLFNK